MYTDYIQLLRNINKTHGRIDLLTPVKHRKQTWRIHANHTTASNDEHITADNPPRTVRCGDKKWAKHAVPDEGVLHL